MFDTASMTEFWFRVLGLYFVAAGIGVSLQMDRLGGLVGEIRDNFLLRFIAGLMAFAFGVVILATHDGSAGGFALIITVIGWGGLLKGLFLLAAPGASLAVYDGMVGNRMLMRIWALLIPLIGLVMLWLGFAG